MDLSGLLNSFYGDVSNIAGAGTAAAVQQIAPNSVQATATSGSGNGVFLLILIFIGYHFLK